MKKMLVLYRELAGYFVTCMRQIADKEGVRIDIIAYPVNAEAPFQFDFGPNIQVFRRSDVDLAAMRRMVEKENYNLFFCGGWTDGDYIKLVREFRNIPSLVGFDKQWLGGWRDAASAFKNRLTIRSAFDYAFVPGIEQKNFALKMGFEENAIVTGAYSCDLPHFSSIGKERMKQPNANRRRKLWYAGRYVAQKDVLNLFSVVASIFEEGFDDWEMHGVGTGDQFNEAAKHQRIFHHGFCQPKEMAELMMDGDLFVLPSLYEPWGVVVHEFAAAGYPLILSDKVGARTAFLREGKNGDVFRAGQTDELKQILVRWMSKDAATLRQAGMLSMQLAESISPETYAASVVKMMR